MKGFKDSTRTVMGHDFGRTNTTVKSHIRTMPVKAAPMAPSPSRRTPPASRVDNTAAPMTARMPPKSMPDETAKPMAKGGLMKFAKGGLVKKAAAKGALAKTAGVKSPTSTSTEVRSPTSTSTSTKADTKHNVTVTGGAGDGDTIVHIGVKPMGKSGRFDEPLIKPKR